MLETNAAGAIQTSYVYGLMGVLSQRQGQTTNYLLGDVQNSTRLLTDATGTVVQQYTYSAFGELADGVTPATRYLYTGQQYEASTQLYNLRARSYAPETGRFLSRDTWTYNFQNPTQLNRYVYAANNPVRWMDPSGLDYIGYTNTTKVEVSTTRTTLGPFSKSFVYGFAGGIAGWITGKIFVHGIKKYISERDSRLQPEVLFSSDLVVNAFNFADMLIAGFIGALIEMSNNQIGSLPDTFDSLYSWQLSSLVENGFTWTYLGGLVSNSLNYLLFPAPDDFRHSLEKLLDFGRVAVVAGITGVSNQVSFDLARKIPGGRSFLSMFLNVLSAGIVNAGSALFDDANGL